MHCYDCENDFIPSPTFPPEEGKHQLCCLCLWPYLMTYNGEECVMGALWTEIEELLSGIEGDFERVIPMNETAEEECNYVHHLNKCGDECGYGETCPYNNIFYKLP